MIQIRNIVSKISFMTTKSVLITDKVHQVLIAGLIDLGYNVNYDTSIDNSALEKIIDQYEGVIVNSKIILNKERIDLGHKLQFIGRLGSGLEIIDVIYAREKGIPVYNSPEGNRNAVAEHEMGMLLTLLNHLHTADKEVRSFSWNREKNRGRELKGQTVGIIGLGNTGSTFAEKLASWGVRVIAYDKYRTDYPISLDFVEKVDLDTVMSDSDIISLHLPLTTETKHLISNDFISKCKNGVIISNTSRGQVVDTDALVQSLQSGKVGGACLDVFENEKPETFTDVEKSLYQILYDMSNVVVTPHIAGWTQESLELIARVLLNKISHGIKS